MKSSKPVIGLIGGIGSGKSFVAELLVQRGARIVSGDAAGHAALRQPEIRQKLVERWGRRVLDEGGAISRRAVGKIVFADEAERTVLEALVFPWIEGRLREQLAEAQADSDAAFIVLDAAIMLETGWDRMCNCVVFVGAPPEQRLSRLAAQRGWNTEEVELREHAQMPLSEKAGRADYVLDNSGSAQETARQVDDLLRQWRLLRS